MKEKVYRLDEIEFIDQPTEAKKFDLTQKDSSDLFMIIQRTFELSRLFEQSASLETLKRRVDQIFIYTADQWEFVEVEFQYKQEEDYNG